MEEKDLIKWINKLIKQDKMYQFYKSKKWINLKNEVMEEFHHECYLCRQQGKISRAYIVHHIFHVRDYPQYALSRFVLNRETGKKERNLIAVCLSCHETVCHPEKREKALKKLEEKKITEFNNEEKW